MKNPITRLWVLLIVLVIAIGLLYFYFIIKPNNANTGQSYGAIRDLKRKDIPKGYYNFKAYAVSVDVCICPPKAFCEPCSNSIIISDTNTNLTTKDKLDADMIKIFTTDTDKFIAGRDYDFKIFISDPAKKSVTDYPNGIDLVEFN